MGVFLILVLVFLFYLQGIRPLQHGEAQIKKNEEIVNTVQTSAMDMVDLARELNTLTLAHVGEVAAFIVQYQQVAERTLPYIQQVATRFKSPGADKIGEMVNNKYVLKEKALLASILLTADRTKEVLAACRREQSSNHGSREANTYVVQITGKSARMDHVRQQKRVRDGDRMIWKGTSVPPLRPR